MQTNVMSGPSREQQRTWLRAVIAAILLASVLPLAAVRGQQTLWVGRLGTDTAVVEAVERTGSRIAGTIVNVAAGLLLQRYEVDLDANGDVRSLRSWTRQDLATPIPPDQVPSVAIEIGRDSIRVTRAGRNGLQVTTVPSREGVVPIFDAFFNNPMALMDLAFGQAARRGDGMLRLYYVGSAQVDELPIAGSGSELSYRYVLARRYPMLGDAQLRARMGDDGLARFDAGETTFKIVTERRPWADPLPLARRFAERGLGTGGLSTMSPPRTASGQVGSVTVTISYGQPSRRGRRVFPDVVPFGQVWRAGANAATKITFSGDVVVAGHRVPAGSYSLWVLPGERSDTLIVSKAADVWGVMYDARQDLIRVPLAREVPETRVEALTYTVSEAAGVVRLALVWDDRRLSVTLEPASGNDAGEPAPSRPQ